MNGRRDRAVPLTPDQIERRGFGIEARGYDRHEVREFLYQVADTLRLALQATGSPTYGAGPTATRGPLGPQVDYYDDAPSETARILRAAYQSATARREEPAAADAAIVERARHEAHELLRRAHAEAEQQRDEARRVLLAAQEQAVDVVADAEARARDLLIAAREDGRRQLDQLAQALEDRSYQVEEAEAVALQRLSAARAELSSAIEMLLGERAAVYEDHRAMGPAPRALDRGTAGPHQRDTDGDDGDEDAEPAEDVVADLIRVAVARAANAGQGAAPPPPPPGSAAAPAADAPDAGEARDPRDPPEGPGGGMGGPPAIPPPGGTMGSAAEGPSSSLRVGTADVTAGGPGRPWPQTDGVEIVLRDPTPDPWAPPLAPPRLLRPGAA